MSRSGVPPPRAVWRRNAGAERALRRAPARWWVPAGRLAALAAVAAVVAVVSTGVRRPEQAALWCCGYTPARLAAGAWWTVPGSALLIVNLHLLGVNTALLLAVVLPAVLLDGFGRTLAVFFAGHVTATLAVAAVVLPLAAAGWHPAELVRATLDVGTSAGVAAVGGALAVSLAQRWPHRRCAGAALFAAFAVDFAVRLLLFHTLAEVEHLAALAVGAGLARRVRTSSPVHGAGVRLNRSTARGEATDGGAPTDRGRSRGAGRPGLDGRLRRPVRGA